MVFFISSNHARSSCSYKMVCLYNKIPKDFTWVILDDCFCLMLIPFWFNMDSICFTNFPMSFFPIRACLLLYLFWTSLGHSRTIWLIVSSVLLHILHFVCSCDLSVFPLFRFVRMACPWAIHFKLFLSFFRVPFSNHYHLSWLPTSLVCHTNWPYNILFLPRNCSFLLLLLLSLYFSFLGWLNQINIHISRSSKQTLSGIFYIVL